MGDPKCVCARRLRVFGVVVFLSILSAAVWTAPSGDPNEFLARLQSDDAKVRRAAWENAGPYGATAVAPLMAILTADDGGDRVKKDRAKAASYALERIAHHASRPGAAEERRVVAAALVKAMEDPGAAKVYDKVLDLLAASAVEGEFVGQIKGRLLDPDARRREMARWALLRIPTSEATKALIEALDKVAPEFRPHIIIALGQKRAPEAVEPLLRLAESKDEATQVEAVCALGRIGDPRATDILKRSVATASDTARPRILDACVRVAESLAEKGQKDAAFDIYGTILSSRSEVHLRCAALLGMGKLATLKAIPFILPALADESGQVRSVATQSLVGLQDEGTNRALLDAYKASPPDVRAAVLRVLSARQAPERDELLQQAMKDQNAEVRVTAFDLLGKLDDPTLEASLLEAAERGSSQIKPAALRGYVKWADALLARKETDKALAMYHRALELGPPADVIRAVLTSLRSMASAQSLPRVEALFDRKDVGGEARRTFLAIAVAVGKGGEKDRAIKMLDELVQGAREPDVIQSAINALRSLGADTTGYAAKMGLITRWHVIGPYPVDSVNPWNKAWSPEIEVELDQSQIVGDTTLIWKKVATDDPQGKVNLAAALGARNSAVAYAYAEIEAPRERDILLRLGSDDGIACWWNGKPALAKNVKRSWQADEDTVKARLNQGTNRLLVKIINSEGDWVFSVRVTNTQNRPIDLTRFE